MKKISKKSYKKFKKICFFLPSLKTGGAEKVLINVANNISKDIKFKVFFITGNSNGIYKKFLSTKIKTINLGEPRLRYTFFKLVNIFKNEKFDHVLTTMPHSNVFLCFIKILYNFKFKLFVRQSNIYNFGGFNLNKSIFIILMKIMYRFSDGVISNCKEVYYETSNFFKIPKNKNHLIYNPTDLKRIKKLSKKKIGLDFFNTKSKTIISVGKLSNQKNFGSLINCANYIVNDLKKDFKFLLIGEGENFLYLKKRIKKFNLQNNFKIINFVENPFKYINKSDLLVQTSLWEGSSNILIESLACDTRVVCYNIPGGTKEILANYTNGQLARLNDYKHLAKKIFYSLKIKKKIDRRKLLLFDLEKNIKQYKKLFNN